MTNIRIPDYEFLDRYKKIQQAMKSEDIDVVLAYGNEAEPQFIRYLCDYWPSFETAGVMIGQTGNPILIIGPESLTFAQDHSRIKQILRVQSFRESSNPEYPDLTLDTIDDAIDIVCNKTNGIKLAVVGSGIISHIVYKDLEKTIKKRSGVIFDRDDLIMKFRMIKSENEINCIRKASDISHQAMKYTIDNIKLGMTELQVRGLGVQKIYELDGENEAYPMWTLSGEGGNQAIGRARHKIIKEGELIHIGVGARYEGYASTIGRQVIFGTPEKWMVDAIKIAYEAHEKILEQLFDGNNARKVADTYYNVMKEYKDWLLYGPCHATGLMEGEPPWIESNSDYILKENMTYCIDIFMHKPGTLYGFRVEDSVRVGRKTGDNLTNFPKEIYTLSNCLK